MEQPLAGKHAIVTGAASGIGSGISAALLRAGAAVTLVDRDADGVAAQAAALAEAGRVETAVGDITEAEFAAAVVGRDPRPDVLVNAAGIRVFVSFADYDAGQFERHLGVNLVAPAHWMQLVARRLAAERAPGSIINILSVGAFRAFPDDGPYVAAKHGLLGMTRSAALDLGPAGVRVNAIAPGPTRTPLTEELFADPAVLERMSGRIPLGRVGAPGDFGGAAVFLASDASAYITGTTIVIDGGYSLQ